MSDEEGSPYNNTNRAFLQALLARSTITYEEAKPILAAIFTAHGMPTAKYLKAIAAHSAQRKGRLFPKMSPKPTSTPISMLQTMLSPRTISKSEAHNTRQVGPESML